MSASATKTNVLLARVVVFLVISFFAAGVFTYGFSAEVRDRVWHDLLERPSQLFRLRFILQPVMAGIAALRDGAEDARLGHTPYLWALLSRPSKRLGRLEEGIMSTARVLLLALVMDTAYQLVVLASFYPVEADIVAITLAFIPYVLLRGPIRRIARWRRDGGSADRRQ